MFEDILKTIAKEIVEWWLTNEEQILFVLRKNLNPFPQKPQDNFLDQWLIKF